MLSLELDLLLEHKVHNRINIAVLNSLIKIKYAWNKILITFLKDFTNVMSRIIEFRL